MKYAKREHKNTAEAMEFEEKEQEIIDSFDDEELDIDVLPDDKKIRRAKLIINIIFSIIVILIIMVAIDIICVSRYNKGPFFAIPTHTYKDGGTKEYYGLGYKVIKYKQLQGRRDMEIGTWSLEYDIEPITIEDIDLAIRFNKNEVKTYNDLYKKFVRINSTLKKVDKKNNTITIGYEDEEGKYTMDIICNMANKDGKIYDFEVGKEITIIGTVYDMKGKTAKTPTTLKIKNCFAEQ